MKILCIGAHYDDIELNCAGTLLKAKDNGAVLFSVVCTDGVKGGQNREAEQVKADALLGIRKSWHLNLPDLYLQHNFDLINPIDKVVQEVEPDYIFTHTIADTNNDHIAVAKAVRSANRGFTSSLLTFPAQDLRVGFSANLYVNITPWFKEKLNILDCFVSQKSHLAFNEDNLMQKHLGTGVGKFVERFRIEYMALK